MTATDCQILLVDIEGTITPITFVTETLFPFVLNNLDSFLDEQWGTSDLQPFIEELRVQAGKDVDAGLPEAVVIPADGDDAMKEAVKKNIRWQMHQDRKIGALKSFQGYMWKSGFVSGELKGIVYDDVIPVLEQWQQQGKKNYIYSSGSVPAQKLLVGHSNHGDISSYFSGYFDTAVGLKVEASSYECISQAIGVAPASILFVSDNIREIEAAAQAGLKVLIASRPGNAPLPESHPFTVITSFDQIQ
ncbi:2,3-diketo-5-methylthio-1-phosphopentane phosphatase [Hesseltinella vesiculosa]|uniref:Enolase-phosphatase E1 n=1 Tax=Hesseltinella vesiculosa TaxID=101127 RepID=A0A1X2GIJ4_9FUNG|nr:2,3-diketo-5-methylthio-1-phosphopentane phosphatase [Hesseltinella vesiculosa]